MGAEGTTTSYRPPQPIRYPSKWLVVDREGSNGESFEFFNHLEIGRYKKNRDAPGRLLVGDPTVSSLHCIISQDPDGRCFVRDTSRNGTRIDGRRLSPNLKTELRIGQILSVGKTIDLRLEGETPTLAANEQLLDEGTMGFSNSVLVTVLVGDIRDYTVLVQQAARSLVQDSVGRVFQQLEHAVVKFGGTLKEFQGDAIFAFWEAGSNRDHTSDACTAALALNRLVEQLAEDPSVWQVEGFPLHMDWALATGHVMISGYGSEGALGLSMVGEPVVLAFRIEKFADQSTGPIIACEVTQKLACNSFEFEDLGSREAKGFDNSHKLFSLLREQK
jgi:adenylate cyclase